MRLLLNLWFKRVFPKILLSAKAPESQGSKNTEVALNVRQIGHQVLFLFWKQKYFFFWKGKENLPCKTIPRGIFTFVSLNLEIEDFNDKADRCLKTVSQSRVYMLQERAGLCLGQGGGWTSHLVPGPSPNCLTHPFTVASKPTEVLEGTEVGQNKGNRKQGRKRKGTGDIVCLYKSIKKKISTRINPAAYTYRLPT